MAERGRAERGEGAAFGAQAAEAGLQRLAVAEQRGVDQPGRSPTPVVSPTIASTSASVTVLLIAGVEKELFELAADGEAVAAEVFRQAARAPRARSSMPASFAAAADERCRGPRLRADRSGA